MQVKRLLPLLPWLLAPLVQLPFAYGAVVPPEGWRVLVECVAFWGLGLIQLRFAPEGVARSPLQAGCISPLNAMPVLNGCFRF